MRTERMAWLDALRAVAAFLVIYAHLTRFLMRGAREVTADWLNAGPAGVMLFFLVSGYIIPASLERHGSLRQFWVSRVFRLYPLYLAIGVVAVVLGALGLVTLDPHLALHPVSAVAAHLTMLPFVLSAPLVTPVFWTLTFEMAFYLVAAGLFAVGRHRSSGAVAVVLAVVAVVSAPLTPHLLARTQPAAFLLIALVVVLLAAGGVAIFTGRGTRVAAAGLGVLALVLLIANQDPSHEWDAVLILSVMFTGTAIYRADQGQTSWRPPLIAGSVVAIAVLINWFAELSSLNGLNPTYMTRSVVTLLVFGGGFMLAWRLRARRVPRWLAWLGMISYSLYLVHYVLIQALAPVLTVLGEQLHGPVELVAVAGFLALLIGLSWLAHRFVERPGQRLGKRLVERWRTPTPVPLQRRSSARDEQAVER